MPNREKLYLIYNQSGGSGWFGLFWVTISEPHQPDDGCSIVKGRAHVVVMDCGGRGTIEKEGSDSLPQRPAECNNANEEEGEKQEETKKRKTVVAAGTSKKNKQLPSNKRAKATKKRKHAASAVLTTKTNPPQRRESRRNCSAGKHCAVYLETKATGSYTKGRVNLTGDRQKIHFCEPCGGVFCTKCVSADGGTHKCTDLTRINPLSPEDLKTVKVSCFLSQ